MACARPLLSRRAARIGCFLLMLASTTARAQDPQEAHDAEAPDSSARPRVRHTTGRAVFRIERAEIDAHAFVASWQLLQRSPHVQLVRMEPGGLTVISRRAWSITPSVARPCRTRLAINGLVLADSPVDLSRDLPTLHEIETLEVFTGPATIASEFGGIARDMVCGLIAVWTM